MFLTLNSNVEQRFFWFMISSLPAKLWLCGYCQLAENKDLCQCSDANVQHVLHIWVLFRLFFIDHLAHKLYSLIIKQKIHHDVIIFWCNVIAIFFCFIVFFLSSLITGPSFMSTWLQVLELWQFLSISNLARNLELENTPCLSFFQYLENGAS